jgi:hypothetical protein
LSVENNWIKQKMQFAIQPCISVSTVMLGHNYTGIKKTWEQKFPRGPTVSGLMFILKENLDRWGN